VLLVVVVSTIGFLFAFSGGAAWLYWGAAFTPLLAAMAPGALAWTVRTPGEDDAEGSTAD